MNTSHPVSRNRFFHAFRWLVNAAWYANFVLAAVGLYYLCRTMFGEPTFNFSALVHLSGPLSAVAVPGGVVEPLQAQLKLDLPVNGFHQASAFVFFFLFEFLVMGALYNLRRLMRSLHAGNPFTGEAIRRLRFTALFIGLLAPYNLLLSVLQAEIAYAYVPAAARTFQMNWNFGLPYIAVAAVIIIVVDVFRYGMQLQQENEAFV